MLKLRFGFTGFAHKCVFCKYPNRGCFGHFVSNGIVSCSVILLFLSSPRAAYQHLFVVIIPDMVVFIIIIKGSSPEAKPYAFCLK